MSKSTKIESPTNVYDIGLNRCVRKRKVCYEKNIRAWAVLSPNQNLAATSTNGAEPQYPIFDSIKVARKFKSAIKGVWGKVIPVEITYTVPLPKRKKV